MEKPHGHRHYPRPGVAANAFHARISAPSVVSPCSPMPSRRRNNLAVSARWWSPTDDEEIAEVARQLGAEVPFLRPANLADDHTGTTPVVIDTIQRLDSSASRQSTTAASMPQCHSFRPADLSAAHDRLLASQAPFVYTVAEFGFPIQRAVRMDAAGQSSAPSGRSRWRNALRIWSPPTRMPASSTGAAAQSWLGGYQPGGREKGSAIFCQGTGWPT